MHQFLGQINVFHGRVDGGVARLGGLEIPAGDHDAGGVVAYVRVGDGSFARHEMVRMMGTGQRVEIEDLGYFGPEMVPLERRDELIGDR